MSATKPRVGSIVGSVAGIILFLAALALAALETGTARLHTPPGPDVAAGSINGAGYVFHRWPTGRSVFLWHDLPSAVAGHGSGSTQDAAYVYVGRAGDGEGAAFDWEASTIDGRTIVVRIADEEFTLAEDAVFFVRARGTRIEVRRLVRDLTQFATNHEGALAMVEIEPAVSAFVAEAADASSGGESAASTPTPGPRP